MTDLLTLVAQVADDLTNPRRHVEVLGAWDHNRNRKTVRRIITLPSLLDQLAEAVIPGESYVEDDGTRSGFGSRPPARLDAVDRLLAIEVAAARWCWALRIDLRNHVDSNIRAIVGAAGGQDFDTQRRILGDLERWRSWAETVVGWTRPPDAPRAPCPVCDATGALRVRLDRQTGCCVACGAAWDANSVGLLAEHVIAYQTRSEADARAAWSRAARDAAVRELVTTAALNVDEAGQCLDALADMPLREAIRVATEASRIMIGNCPEPVELCRIYATTLAAERAA